MKSDSNNVTPEIVVMNPHLYIPGQCFEICIAVVSEENVILLTKLSLSLLFI